VVADALPGAGVAAARRTPRAPGPLPCPGSADAVEPGERAAPPRAGTPPAPGPTRTPRGPRAGPAGGSEELEAPVRRGHRVPGGGTRLRPVARRTRREDPRDVEEGRGEIRFAGWAARFADGRVPGTGVIPLTSGATVERAERKGGVR